MLSKPMSFAIPPEIAAGLRSGDLIQYGGIVRNQLGQIVKHLEPVPLPLASEKAAARLAGMLRNPRAIIPTVVLGTAAVAAIAVAKKPQRSGKAIVPACVLNYNASLVAYMEAVHEGRLGLDTIDRLIADLDEVKAHSERDGGITLDFSTKHAEMLVNTVVDYTRQLADANSVKLDGVEECALAHEDGGVIALRRNLEVQRQIFTDTA